MVKKKDVFCSKTLSELFYFSNVSGLCGSICNWRPLIDKWNQVYLHQFCLLYVLNWNINDGWAYRPAHHYLHRNTSWLDDSKLAKIILRLFSWVINFILNWCCIRRSSTLLTGSCIWFDQLKGETKSRWIPWGKEWWH